MDFKIFFLVLNFSIAGAQIVHHQAIGTMGSSGVSRVGVYVNQTLGQQSNLGSFTSNRFIVQQGFQQSIFSATSNSTAKKISTLTILMYPNPVSSVLNFDFSNNLNEYVVANIFDSTGKLILTFRKMITTDKLYFDGLNFLPVGSYIVSLEGLSVKYSAKFLKI